MGSNREKSNIAEAILKKITIFKEQQKLFLILMVAIIFSSTVVYLTIITPPTAMRATPARTPSTIPAISPPLNPPPEHWISDNSNMYLNHQLKNFIVCLFRSF